LSVQQKCEITLLYLMVKLLSTTPQNSPISTTSAYNTTASPMDIILWHRRFSHLNYPDLKSMISKNLVTGISIKSLSTPDPICEPCLAGNQRRIVNKTATRHHHPLDLVYTDLHGPVPTQSPEGYRYWCVFVDDYSRHWSIYFMRTKDQAFEAFKLFKASVELQTGFKIKALQDEGGEVMSKVMEQYLADCGIQRRHTMRNEPIGNRIRGVEIG